MYYMQTSVRLLRERRAVVVEFILVDALLHMVNRSDTLFITTYIYITMLRIRILLHRHLSVAPVMETLLHCSINILYIFDILRLC